MISEICVDLILSEIISSAIELVSQKVPIVDDDEKPSDEQFRDDFSTGKSKVKPKVYPCPDCGKLYAQLLSATNHCKVKQGSLTSMCPQCGIEIRKKNMQRHAKIHNETEKEADNHSLKKPSTKCDGCGNHFSSIQKLNNHMKLKHGVQKPEPVKTNLVNCTECGFSHVKESIVKAHFSKVHEIHNDKLKCDICKYTCVSRSSMWKHMKKHKTPASSETIEVSVPRTPLHIQNYLPSQNSLPSNSGHGVAKLLHVKQHHHPQVVPPVSILDAELPNTIFQASQIQPSPADSLINVDEGDLIVNQLISNGNIDFDNFFSENSSGFGRIHVTEDGKELYNL